VAGALTQTASALQSYQATYTTQLQGTITKVNQLVSQIADAEKEARATGAESLADTKVYGALDELSSLIDFTVLHGSDGSLTILGGGQVPLLQSGKTFSLSVASSQPAGSSGGVQSPPQVLDAFGHNINSSFHSGEVAGLVDLTNNVLPSLIGGGGTTGSLNQLATELGTRVNQALSPGKPLFAWNSTQASNSALTFSVVSGFQESDLPTTGTPLTNLVALGSDSTNLTALGGQTFQNFVTSQVQKLAVKANAASDHVSVSESLLAQAQNLRTQTSGVTLEEEAVDLLQLQHSFQAVSRLIATINDLVDSVFAMKS
jgi:flagellar hook-associated protein 1 FlgK